VPWRRLHNVHGASIRTTKAPLRKLPKCRRQDLVQDGVLSLHRSLPLSKVCNLPEELLVVLPALHQELLCRLLSLGPHSFKPVCHLRVEFQGYRFAHLLGNVLRVQRSAAYPRPCRRSAQGGRGVGGRIASGLMLGRGNGRHERHAETKLKAWWQRHGILVHCCGLGKCAGG